MQVVVDHNLVEYQLIGQGSGPTVLLLHGWTETAQQSFANLARQLSSEYQVLLPDLPGFGQSPMPPPEWGIPEYASLVKHFVDKLDLAPEVVVAHSNGGTLALHLIAYGLLAPQKLILLSSAGIRDKARVKKTILKTAAKPVKLLLKPLPPRTQERIKKRIYTRLGSDLYVLAGMKPIFKRVVAYDAQTDASQVHVPTLLIYGDEDTSTPPAFGEQFRDLIPDARLEIVTAAGHYVQLDQPERTLQLIKDFLG